MRNRDADYRCMMEEFHALLPVVHAHFRLPPESKQVALIAARRSQRRAVDCYRAIARSLTYTR